MKKSDWVILSLRGLYVCLLFGLLATLMWDLSSVLLDIGLGLWTARVFSVAVGVGGVGGAIYAIIDARREKGE